MKYICTVDINLPIDDVVKLWEDEASFIEWQDGFKSIDLISGRRNEMSAKSKIVLEDKRRIELIETIIKYDLPREKTALYEHIHMTNTQMTRFVALKNGQTQYISLPAY